MAQVLLINPNTTASVTERLAPPLAEALGPAHRLRLSTARFGADYIASEAAYCVAGHAALDAYACHGEGADGVLVGCFGDPGVFALRELCPGPVIGLAEASMRLAARRGRFAIVTGGVRWRPMLERLARSLGLEASLQQIELVSLTGAQLAADPPGALRLLARACADATRGGADSVILGGAALVGMAGQLAPQVPVPLIDNVQAGGQMMREALAANPGSAPAGPDGARWQGIGAELTALLGPRP